MLSESHITCLKTKLSISKQKLIFVSDQLPVTNTTVTNYRDTSLNLTLAAKYDKGTPPIILSDANVKNAMLDLKRKNKIVKVQR